MIHSGDDFVMKKIKNISIGGIQQKIFNLVLIMILLVMAAYTIVIFYQGNRLNQLVTETNEKQKQSITSITSQTMDGVISASLSSSTQMKAKIADDMFENVANVVRMTADYAEKLFEAPENYAPYPVSLPVAADDGKISVQLLMAEGVDPEAPEIAEKIGLIAPKRRSNTLVTNSSSFFSGLNLIFSFILPFMNLF